MIHFQITKETTATTDAGLNVNGWIFCLTIHQTSFVFTMGKVVAKTGTVTKTGTVSEVSTINTTSAGANADQK